jgi:hypothetical protein
MPAEQLVAIPDFDELPRLPGGEERYAWDVWGPDDQLGTVNFIGPEQRRFAASLVRSGRVIGLSLPLDQPSPGLFAGRQAPLHTIEEVGHGRDDHVDGFYLQFSSQWDGLRHVRYRQHGFWGGRQDADIDSGGALGIEHWARHGLISRGVLIDAVSHCARHGEPLIADQRRALEPSDLDAIVAEEGVEIRPGDIVLVRTGWLEWYMSRDEATRTAMVGTVGGRHDPLSAPGLHAGRATARWLWNHRVGAVACDNPTVEALPVERETGFLHYRLLPLLGMPLGEFWPMEELTRHCEQSGRYEFMLFSGVLNLPGGVGSPNSAYAVF